MRCPYCGSVEVHLLHGKDHKKIVAKTIVHRKGCVLSMKGGLESWLFKDRGAD